MSTASISPAPTDILGVFDDPRYAALAVDNATKYQSADPFPHGVYDNFLPTNWRPTFQRRSRHQTRSSGCRGTTPRTDGFTSTTRRNCRRSTGRCFASSTAGSSCCFSKPSRGSTTCCPIPYFIGGGLHLSRRGDFLNVHADFNWHHKLQAHRRVNALMYLSDTWDEEWGGAVEFWDKDMTGAVDKAYPIFNRLVVFSTSENSNHGQPEHNKCPEGTYRKVINLYYYTTHRDDEDAAAHPHFTLYKTGASEFATELGDTYRRSGENG